MVSSVEVQQACKRLQKKKTSADDGMVAEMLQTEYRPLLDAIAMLFTDLLNGAQEIPDTWRQTRLIVIFKKGNATSPSSYRPIAVLPVLYKLFATILLGRIKDILDRFQPLEQAGFRSGFSCADHIHALRLICEKASECGETLWFASLDLEKAFDNVLHEHVFGSLCGTGIETEVVDTLQRIYSDLPAYVQLEPGNKSRTFPVLRGVRQGDPLSPVLFINVLRKLLSDLGEKWEKGKRGSIVGAWGDEIGRLTHLLFADDTTLVAKSKKDLLVMLKDIQQAFAEAGLVLNVGKCQIQTNAHTARTPSHVDLDGKRFPIVPPWEGFKILGTQLTAVNGTRRELDIRISAAWGKFHQIWPLLRRRHTDLKKRLRLFEANVGRSLLWCCESWTLSLKEKQRLQSTERAMLRRFAGPRRAPDQEYIDWIREATHRAEKSRDEAGIRSWCAAAAFQKWHWAGHVARMSDHRWAARMTKWRGSEWWVAQDQRSSKSTPRPMRARPGHFTRWEEELVKFSTNMGWGHWKKAASERSTAEWNSFSGTFSAIACKSLTRRVD